MAQSQQRHVAPFSFHCRICYERLNLTDRPPVVLPCGHTYICQVCSLKLTRCMECRTRIVPIKRPPQAQQTAARGYRHRHSQQRHQNYQYPVPTTVDELHKDAPPPPLPKNVVLMSLMEVAEQKVGASAGSDEEDAYESGDDDARVMEGLRTLCSSYGTYVVKAKEGLWVYDGKPSPQHALPAAKPLSRNNSTSSADPPGKSPTKENLDPASALVRHRSGSNISHHKNTNNHRGKSPIGIGDSDSSLNHSITTGILPPTRVVKVKGPGKPVERLIHGQTVQVVFLGATGLAQLARGGGYIQVEREEQLVKVGEPTEEACRIEGIIFSILEERKQYKNRISNLKKLEKSMQTSLREFYIKEAQELEEKRAMAKAEQLEREKNNLVNTSVALSLLEEDDAFLEEDDDFEDDLFPLDLYRQGTVTPPPSPHLRDGPDASRRRRQSAAAADADSLVNPQAPPAYHYEMHPSSIRSMDNNNKGNKNVKDNAHNAVLTWEEDLFQRGCDLLFCAIPLCIGPTSSSAVHDVAGMGAAGPALQPTSSILTGGPGPHSDDSGQGQPGNGHHYYHLYQSPPIRQYHDPSLDRNESGDGGDNGSALSSAATSASGVDFSTGLSGHTGISRGGTRRQPIRKKEVRMMMSVHDGIAHIRRQQHNHSGAASVMSQSSKASITTL